MASFKNMLRGAGARNRYEAVRGKENKGYLETPRSKSTQSHMAKSAGSQSCHGESSEKSKSQSNFRRNSSVTQSVRDVVGTIRQKLKKSTRQRKRLQDGINSPMSPTARSRKSSKKIQAKTTKGGYREVSMYSPFQIETPKSRAKMGIRARPRWHDVETPTRLRKEVEDLTANMQALVNLTPGTLQTRSRSRRSLQCLSPITNGSLKTPRAGRRREQITEI
ncbi:uncharacterized protein LOC132720886 [Ruditapes philippinarum]|uniref:uncharacterized protein LOC132720886 n=1 Tax=Ruditapes philippinarum TaxID=129788 RepID=UPI00295AF203|nr:uncharacterized protein LOC132720886 [Ruditapes philippinarum]